MDKIKNIKKALDQRKILKDIKTDSLSLKLSGNIIIINDRYFIHGRFYN